MSYQSPRWSGEILDCSMPVTFDTYDRCSYNCAYCFSFFQKLHNGIKYSGTSYQSSPPGHVSYDYVKSIFTLERNSQFSDYIRAKKTIQWGGLSDPFDEHERKEGRTLKLLKMFKKLDYPICFSTKATWWTEDKRYADLFRRQKNWNVKVSIICLNKDRARIVEKGCPSPGDRLRSMRTIADWEAGGVTLRLRPFILGLSDRDEDYLRLIDKASHKGADAISTEFLCLDSRADPQIQKRYNLMSRVVGFDLYDYYRKNSSTTGYFRLTRTIKEKYINNMEAKCKEVGMRFYVSDAHFKERCHNGSCCGLPDSWKYSRAQFTEALMIAKAKGEVHFSDIADGLDTYKKFDWQFALGYNTSGCKRRAAFKHWTMYDWFVYQWNTPNSLKSPYKYFGGILRPTGLDKDKNVVYKYVRR